ncbi:transposase [Aeromonas veronii]|uniref:transposase n=1 Tax=Aeromonas veronii TaxID=654 RepID=UPI004042471A
MDIFQRDLRRHDHHGRRGRSQLYTDQTICTFLMLKGIFSLTLRVTQGLLDPCSS